MKSEFKEISEMLDKVVGGQSDNALFAIDVESTDGNKKCSTICSTSCEGSIGSEKGTVSGTITGYEPITEMK